MFKGKTNHWEGPLFLTSHHLTNNDFIVWYVSCWPDRSTHFLYI